MGLSHEQYANELKRLNPVVVETPATQFDPEIEDATVGNEERLRGIPAVGRVSGTIKGTRPGDSAKALEQAGRDIVRATLDRNRYRPKEQT